MQRQVLSWTDWGCLRTLFNLFFPWRLDFRSFSRHWKTFRHFLFIWFVEILIYFCKIIVLHHQNNSLQWKKSKIPLRFSAKRSLYYWFKKHLFLPGVVFVYRTLLVVEPCRPRKCPRSSGCCPTFKLNLGEQLSLLLVI